MRHQNMVGSHPRRALSPSKRLVESPNYFGSVRGRCRLSLWPPLRRDPYLGQRSQSMSERPNLEYEPTPVSRRGRRTGFWWFLLLVLLAVVIVSYIYSR